ncbi:hypothetical protein AB205_0178540 [Aquarana catesbeiana]|uniref:Uncharacterized protein n=1 Tax=Aquarana catesbeiana TaxID=8400 RepID=A0A2G9RWC0_AQUCT|nr:hypothetical protein AB205_0178540 [Aquarana catesbeiana]
MYLFCVCNPFIRIMLVCERNKGTAHTKHVHCSPMMGDSKCWLEPFLIPNCEHLQILLFYMGDITSTVINMLNFVSSCYILVLMFLKTLLSSQIL